ncbi:hypothetical protein FisN_2Hh284 [Fistulifera solaris]|uniref:Uncharacterized protein n=1 Tax=Fistulifera solaris TaxID=1519565 RepID=A0A1Z5JEL9_FISSO|nr:hypothetical protein FisN_2Hh284 [Fistulifera solaris]|eukprot:GAX12450.1 hypothetical protein FisN_2Hh284 [Fistulifera solaris]
MGQESRKRSLLHFFFLLIAFQLPFFYLSHRHIHDDEPAIDLVTVGNENATNISFNGSERVEFLHVSDRVFPRWNKPLPCYNVTIVRPKLGWHRAQNLKQPTKEGLFFVKLLKTGSTTGASIHLRIARNLAKRRGVSPICRTRHLHGWAGRRMYNFGQRDLEHSFLWTLLREPTPRYISEFFHFQVSRKNVSATDDNIIEFLRHGTHSDRHYLSWLTLRGYRKATSRVETTLQYILDDYDFMGILERLDESVVALQMILNVSLADVLSVSSKLNGGHDDGQYQKKCFLIQPSFVSSGVQAFLESEEWQEYIGPEQALYNAVNRSLDRTIDALGREIFAQKLLAYQQAMKAVSLRCQNVRFPCSESGERRSETDCLAADMGCGFECLDQVSNELNLW